MRFEQGGSADDVHGGAMSAVEKLAGENLRGGAGALGTPTQAFTEGTAESAGRCGAGRGRGGDEGQELARSGQRFFFASRIRCLCSIFGNVVILAGFSKEERKGNLLS